MWLLYLWSQLVDCTSFQGTQISVCWVKYCLIQIVRLMPFEKKQNKTQSFFLIMFDFHPQGEKVGDSWRHVITHLQVGASDRNKTGVSICHVSTPPHLCYSSSSSSQNPLPPFRYFAPNPPAEKPGAWKMWSWKTPTLCWILLVGCKKATIMFALKKNCWRWPHLCCDLRWKQQPELSVRCLSVQNGQQQQQLQLPAGQPPALLQSPSRRLSASDARTGKCGWYVDRSLLQY